MQRLIQKRGDTWIFYLERVHADGSPFDCSGLNVTCAIEMDGARTTFTTTEVDASVGQHLVVLDSETVAGLQAGTYTAEIEYRDTAPDPDFVKSTESWYLRCAEDIVNAG